ncbi:DUF3455 domain-containing protein [Micromonospora sp. NPDC005553]
MTLCPSPPQGASWPTASTVARTRRRRRRRRIAPVASLDPTSAGAGILSNVAYVSRLLTSGGVAPAGACTDGATVAVPYGAVYVFWASKR